jgi:ribosomal protein S3AE
MFKKIIRAIVKEELKELNLEKLVKDCIREVIHDTVMEQARKINIEAEVERRINIVLQNVDEKLFRRIIKDLSFKK